METFILTVRKTHVFENNKKAKDKVLNGFPVLLENNEANEVFEINIQRQSDQNSMKQKPRQIPLDLQGNMEREMERLK